MRRVTLAVLAANSGLCLCCRQAGVTHTEEQFQHLPLIKSQICQCHKGLPRGEQSIVGAINVSHSGDAVDKETRAGGSVSSAVQQHLLFFFLLDLYLITNTVRHRTPTQLFYLIFSFYFTISSEERVMICPVEKKKKTGGLRRQMYCNISAKQVAYSGPCQPLQSTHILCSLRTLPV